MEVSDRSVRKALGERGVRVKSCLHVGQRSRVYQAVYQKDPCVMKVGSLADLDTERKVAELQLSHPSLVTITFCALGRKNGILVMPQLLQPLPAEWTEEQARRYLAQLLSALFYLHSREMAHCKVAANLLWDEKEDKVVLTDFGHVCPVTPELRLQDLQAAVRVVHSHCERLAIASWAWLTRVEQGLATEPLEDLINVIHGDARVAEPVTEPMTIGLPATSCVTHLYYMEKMQALLDEVFSAGMVQLYVEAGSDLVVWNRRDPFVAFRPSRHHVLLRWDSAEPREYPRFMPKDIRTDLYAFLKRVSNAWCRRALLFVGPPGTYDDLCKWVDLMCSMVGWKELQYRIDPGSLAVSSGVRRWTLEDLATFTLEGVPEDKYALQPKFVDWLPFQSVVYLLRLALRKYGVVMTLDGHIDPEGALSGVKVTLERDDGQWWLYVSGKDSRAKLLVSSVFQGDTFLTAVDEARGWIGALMALEPREWMEWQRENLPRIAKMLRELLHNPSFSMIASEGQLTHSSAYPCVHFCKCRLLLRFRHSSFTLTLWEIVRIPGGSVSDLFRQRVEEALELDRHHEFIAHSTDTPSILMTRGVSEPQKSMDTLPPVADVD